MIEHDQRAERSGLRLIGERRLQTEFELTERRRRAIALETKLIRGNAFTWQIGQTRVRRRDLGIDCFEASAIARDLRRGSALRQNDLRVRLARADVLRGTGVGRARDGCALEANFFLKTG